MIVSGPPGAGKTTLAHLLGPALGLPVITKDGIKESLFETLGWSDREWSRKLGAATWTLLFLLLERLLEGGASLLMESNFDRRLHAADIDELCRRHDVELVEVHCTADMATLSRRYLEREASGDRHPGHEGVGFVPDDAVFAEELSTRAHVPLGIARTTIEVDTTDLDRVDLDEIITKIREGRDGPIYR